MLHPTSEETQHAHLYHVLQSCSHLGVLTLTASPIHADFVNVIRRQKALGFNTVRLPFSFSDLLTLSPINRATACPQSGTNPDACAIVQSLLPPGQSIPSGTHLVLPSISIEPAYARQAMWRHNLSTLTAGHSPPA